MQNMQNYNTLEFLQEKAPNIKVDRSFQRKACWSLPQRRRFIVSSLKKRTPYPIVIADINSGIRASPGDSASMEKYKKLQESKYTMVSLDGQNRLETLRSFYNSEFTISGNLLGADKVRYTILNEYYKNLPPRLKDAFDMLEISVSTMKNCVYSELHEIFVDINDGESLNSQEKRNAIMSWFSGYIRDFSELKNSVKLLKRITTFKEDHIRRSLDAEWYSKLFASLLYPNKYNLNSSGLDGLYKQGEARTRSSVADYSQDNIDRFEEIVRMMQKSVFCRSEAGTPITQRQFWTLAAATASVYDSVKRIYNYIDFFDSVIEADSSLCISSENLFLESNRKYTIDSKNNTEPLRSQYYFFWASNINAPSHRNKVKLELVKYLNTKPKYRNSIKEHMEVAAK